jgi:hypothetical protein
VFNEYSRQNANAIDQFRQGHADALNLKDSGIEVIAEISITPRRSEQIILMLTQSN